MEEQLVKVGKVKGGSAVGPYEWVKDGDVIEVPSSLAATLLRQPGGGFFDPEQPGGVQNLGGFGVQPGFTADPEPGHEAADPQSVKGEGEDGTEGERGEAGKDDGPPADKQPAKTPAKTPAKK